MIILFPFLLIVLASTSFLRRYKPEAEFHYSLAGRFTFLPTRR